MEPKDNQKILELGHELRSLRSRMGEKQKEDEQLAQIRKMDSLASLAAGIAHDFNNILQSILGHTQLALLSENNPNRETFRQIEKIIHKGRELTEQFLVFGQKRPPIFSSLDLNQRILGVKSLLRKTTPKMIDIGFDLATDLREIRGDPVQIEQVLMNLAANARDAMPQGGRIMFRTRGVLITASDPFVPLGACEGEYALLSVSDTGCGIAPEHLSRIYEPFFTTKTKSNGRGLGLAIVYAIVKNHGGFINCTSEPGGGTDFSLYFPAATLERRGLDGTPRRAGETPQWEKEHKAPLVA